MPRASAVAITGTAGTTNVITVPRTLWGITVREANAVAAVASVVVRDASAGTATADIALSVSLAANGRRTIVFDEGVKLAVGARVTITGQIEGSLYVS